MVTSTIFFANRGVALTNGTESLALPELTLVPMEPGRHVVTFVSAQMQQKNLGPIAYPCLLLTPMPGPAIAVFDTGDVAWLTSPGQEVGVTVQAPGAIVLFLTIRPSDYQGTGLNIHVCKEQPGHPAPGMGQPFGAPQGQPMPGMARPFVQPAPMMAQAQPFGHPVPGMGQPFGAPQGQPMPGMARPFVQPAPAMAQAQPFGHPVPGMGQPFGAPQMSPLGAPVPPQAAPSGQQVQVHLACHIQNVGDQTAEPGQSAGAPGSHLRLEAVALRADGLDPGALEYAAITLDGRMTPWSASPQFCGTRGMGQPLLGFVARLKGHAEQLYDISYGGTFLQGGQAAEVRNGEFLQSPQPGDGLESLWVRIAPKGRV